MRTIRMLLGSAVLASVLVVPAPSVACFGEICDGICYLVETWDNTTPGEKFDFNRCPVK